MFNLKSNPMVNLKAPESPSVNIIGAGTVIEGDIKSDGDIRIDGTLHGTLNTKGKLVLGTTGVVEGEVSCQNADISGTISGKIKITELLSLKISSKLTGDITTNKLSIEPGANFSGSCVMAGSVPNINLMSKNGKGEAEKSEKSAAY
jgi:cytoskeletal protein CcmA (bactofilin family)